MNMIMILIALIAVTGIAAYCAQKNVWHSVFHEIVCPIFAFFGFLGLIGYAIAGFNYLGAEYKAKILNNEYGTSYTAAEVFFASDVINTVRELDRKRIEINGNLMRDN